MRPNRRQCGWQPHVPHGAKSSRPRHPKRHYTQQPSERIGFCSRACLPAGQREGLLPLRPRDGEIKGSRSPCEGGQLDICRAMPRSIVGHVLWSSRQKQAGSLPLWARAPTLAQIVDQVPSVAESFLPQQRTCRHGSCGNPARHRKVGTKHHCPLQQPSSELKFQSQKPLAPFEFGRMGQH